MNKEHDIRKLTIDDATHLGVVFDYNRTFYVRRPILMRIKDKVIFTFTEPLAADNVIYQRQTWLVESENYWHLPGTGVKYDKITGEQFIYSEDNKERLMNYAILQLSSVVPV